ncbi:MAG TPA: response regulator [Chthoniobacterales bacterium]
MGNGESTYRLDTRASGLAALAAVDGTAQPFDIIIVDQKMPNLTGVEVVTALHERGVKSRIIVLSHLTDEVRKTYEELGVQAIFEKPSDITQLRVPPTPFNFMCSLRRIKGSHHRLRHSDGRVTTAPIPSQ